MDGGGAQSLVDAAKANYDLLKTALSKPKGIHLFFCGEGKSDAERWKKVRISAGLATELKTDVIANLRGLCQGKQIVEYTFDDMVTSAVGAWRKSDIKEIADWMGAVPPSGWAHLFDGNDVYCKGIRFQVFQIDTAHGTLRVFKKKTPTLNLKKSVSAKLDVTKNEFSQIGGPLFNFDVSADFFEFLDFVYIISASAFEILTDVRKVTQDKAKKIITKVDGKKDISIAGQKELFENIAKKPLWSKKIASAERLGTIDALTAQHMIERIDKKKLRIVYKKQGAKTVFTIDSSSPAALRDFVELITDTYLFSEVTGLEYKTFSKGRAS